MVPAPVARHLVGGQPNRKSSLARPSTIDGRAVAGADRESPFIMNFNVTGAARLVAGRRDLFETSDAESVRSARTAVLRQKRTLSARAQPVRVDGVRNVVISLMISLASW